MCLLEDQGSRLVVDRQEHKLCALALGIVQLYGEIVRGGIGKGHVGNDLEALCLALGNEVVVDTGGVNVVVLPDDSDLGAELLLCDLVSSQSALCRVDEAHLEHIVLALGGTGGGSGRGQSENAVAVSLCCGSLARLGGYGAERQLHAPVLQRVVGVDSLLCVALVVLIVQLELNIAALSVDLVNRDLCAVLAGVAVNCVCAGQRAGAADLEGCAGSGAVGRVVCTVGAGGSGRTAAGQRRCQHCAGQKHTECFLHGVSSPFISGAAFFHRPV